MSLLPLSGIKCEWYVCICISYVIFYTNFYNSVPMSPYGPSKGTLFSMAVTLCTLLN
jgi:hypothetical protein